MRSRVAGFILLLAGAAPLLASEAEATGGDSALTIILKLLNVVIFFGIFGWLLANPMRNFFRERNRKVSDELQEARHKREEAEKLLGRVEEVIDGYRKEEKTVKERFEKELVRIEEEGTAAMEREVAAVTTTMESLIDQKVRAAREHLRTETLRMSVEIAEAMLKDQVTDDDRKHFVAKMIEEIGA